MFAECLEEFEAYCKERVAERDSGTLTHTIQTTFGRRYIKLIEVSQGSKSAFAFIDALNGDVFKPASWSAPAPHPRANVLKKETWVNVGPYGPAYLRG